MGILEFIKLALFAITRNKTRAFLTMLGIIIGVGAVITMIGIGEGSKQAQYAITRRIGTNMIMFFADSSSKTGGGPVFLGSVDTLTDDDTSAMDREVSDSVAAATTFVRASKPAVYGNNTGLVGSVAGASPNCLEIK